MTREVSHAADPTSREAQRVFQLVSEFGPLLSFKLYRLAFDDPPGVPVLPCLDHEAMLHGGIPPHAAAYVQEQGAAIFTNWSASPTHT